MSTVTGEEEVEGWTSLEVINNLVRNLDLDLDLVEVDANCSLTGMAELRYHMKSFKIPSGRRCLHRYLVYLYSKLIGRLTVTAPDLVACWCDVRGPALHGSS